MSEGGLVVQCNTRKDDQIDSSLQSGVMGHLSRPHDSMEPNT